MYRPSIGHRSGFKWLLRKHINMGKARVVVRRESLTLLQRPHYLNLLHHTILYLNAPRFYLHALLSPEYRLHTTGAFYCPVSRRTSVNVVCFIVPPSPGLTTSSIATLFQLHHKRLT